MSTATEQNNEEIVAQEVETAVGDKPAAAGVDPKDATRWFEIVEVPEAGFRCFVRLVNEYQHKDVREKAMAAKARRLRALRNPSTDAYEILEFEINQIAEAEGALESLVFELLQERDDRDRLTAIDEINEDEQYKHVAQDQERFRTLHAMTEDERPGDEWKELVEYLATYAQKIQKRVDEIQAPRKKALEEMGLNALLDRVRERRIDLEGRRVFRDTYLFWQTYAGTLVIPEGFDPDHITRETMPRERIFKTEEELRECDPLILFHVTQAFDRLEGALAMLTAGNS